MLLKYTVRSAVMAGALALIPATGTVAQQASPPAAQRPGLVSVSADSGTLAPAGGALAAALAAAGLADPAVHAFYAGRGGAPFWLAPGSSWADSLLVTLDAAGTHGLPVGRYAPETLRALRAGGDADRAEAAFMKAYLAFGRDIQSGVLDPRAVSREIHLDPLHPDPAALLVRLSGAAPADLFMLAPDSAEYRALVAELGRVRDLVVSGVYGRPLGQGRSIRPGGRDPRVESLRAKLRATGDLPATDETVPQPVAASAADADPTLYDEALVEAVKRFQIRLALTPDGVVGAQTVSAINAATDGRHGQILANLERVRWLHRDPFERHIFVNQANFSMEFFDNGRVVIESRVVVGKAGRDFRTPEFTDMMDHLIVNPTWHVPTSIATKEILPLLKKDPTYLQRNGYRLVPVGPDPVPDGVTSDFSQYSIGNFPFRIKQDPSEANALGLVKFMFPNQFSIYLHDTPQKRLFEREVRAYSHGCVRVHRAFDLAYALLEGQVEDPVAAFQSWLGTRRERRVDLDRPVRVYLTYRTAFLDATGMLQFRGDIYGRDALVVAALAAAGVEVLR